MFSFSRLLQLRFGEEQLARNRLFAIRQSPGICRPRRKGPPRSLFYLCWYTQLREWMSMDKSGEWARDLRVLPLPGGGFRGDWYLGVVKGSVSRSLGEDLINNLCSSKEDYKRFARGIGLPTREYFYVSEGSPSGNFYAWPNSSPHEDNDQAIGGYSLQSFYNTIYRGAKHRSHIKNYQKIRPILWTICRQLETRKGAHADDIWRIVRRIPDQVRLLLGQ